MTNKAHPDHQKLYQIAEQQGGYFTSAQAQQAGFTYALFTYHARTGEFVRVAHGIYRLSRFPETPLADLFIAWLRTGPQSVISHESALALHNLSDVLPGEIHVTVSRQTSQRRKNIRLHTKRLSKDETTRRQGLPVTTVPRTLADVILGGLGEELVHQAVQQAIERGLVTREMLQGYGEQRGGRVARVLHRALLEDGQA